MLDGREAMPENGSFPEPHKELAQLSRNQPNVKKIKIKINKQNNKTKETRTVSVTYSISKITYEWSGYLEPTSLIPPSPSEWVHSKAGTFKY